MLPSVLQTACSRKSGPERTSQGRLEQWVDMRDQLRVGGTHWMGFWSFAAPSPVSVLVCSCYESSPQFCPIKERLEWIHLLPLSTRKLHFTVNFALLLFWRLIPALAENKDKKGITLGEVQAWLTLGPSEQAQCKNLQAARIKTRNSLCVRNADSDIVQQEVVPGSSRLLFLNLEGLTGKSIGIF